MDPTNNRYPSLNYPRSRIQLTSVLAIMTSILKDRLCREHVGRVWKWVILICIGSKPFLICIRQFLSIPQRVSTVSPLVLTQSSIHLLFCPVLKIERKNDGNGSFDSKGSWSGCKGDVKVPFESWLFSFLLALVETILKKDSTPTVETLKQLDL